MSVQTQLGDRLRAVRRQQGLTLYDVESRSGGRWKAVVVGSYERADRAISVARLAELAEFYGVPVAELLPTPPEDVAELLDRVASEAVSIDVPRAWAAERADHRVGLIARFADRIRDERGDTHDILSLRASDLSVIAAALEETVDGLVALLTEHRVLV